MTLDEQEKSNLIKRAESGDTEAQNELAARLATGDGFDKDLALAVYWYEKSANSDSSEAAYNLALMYLFGEGVRKNKNKCIDLLLEAVDLGSSDAALLLGESYEMGNLGLNIDYIESAKYYLEATRLGSAKAIHNMGVMLANDNISAKNLADIMLNYEIPSMRIGGTESK